VPYRVRAAAGRALAFDARARSNERVSEPRREQTAWSPGLLGFYAAVGMASLGGAVAGVGFFVVRGGGMRPVLMWIGALMMLAGLLGGIRFLRAARSER